LNGGSFIRVAVLVSGSGTNLQALIDAQNSGGLGTGRLVCVISSKPGVFALERAKKAGIEQYVIDKKQYSGDTFDTALLQQLQSCGAQLVVLAGFLPIIGNTLIEHYPGRIINVHPSLIPSFCGTGFYGLKVHCAALKKGVKVSGATVHLVNEIPDGGEIILQKAVDVLEGDTPQSLQQRIMEQAEWVILPKAVAMLCNKITEGQS